YPSPRPKGELVVFPATQGPKPAWKLAWLFALPAVNTRQGYDVAIAAKNGSVLMKIGERKLQCPSVDVRQGTKTQLLDISSFPQVLWHDPTNATGIAVNDAANPYALSTRTVGPSQELPILEAKCEGETDANKVVGLPVATIPLVDASSPPNYDAASLYVAGQRCLEFLAKTFEYEPGQPWRGFDGTGLTPVELHLWSQDHTTFFNPQDKGFYFNPFTTSGKFYGASIETVCHEIGHGIWDTLVGRRSDDLQSQTLNEGFGDVIGAMAEMSVRGYPGPNEGGWCMFGDEFTNQTCGHNF